jgi:deoxyribodipyrimidine photo-lyase
MRGVVWFREDLRTFDNSALYHASRQCDEGIVAVYILDSKMWIKHEMAACRVDFMLRGLQVLQNDLAKLNIPLIFIEVKKTAEYPTVLARLMRDTHSEALFFNRQYEVNEHHRDAAVEAYLSEDNISVSSYHDQIILPPGSVQTLQGRPYSVFTPYKRAWIKKFLAADIKILPQPKVQKPLPLKLAVAKLPKSLPGFKSTVDEKLWPAGQKAAQVRLQKFLDKNLFQYDTARDFPALDATSKLSAYLASGMISPRQCFIKAMLANDNEIDSGNRGATTWLGELIWRDFYKHILVSSPRISMHKAYQIGTDSMKWNFNATLLKAWQEGKTGYPLIDAAMRQLNTLGWMHNRLRMVVAMFLTKNLFFDWRLGEKYFITHLIDGDLSANNGGWQWSASTGTDSAPYFRIFNPIRQSERFDSDGKFILQYCPELAGLNKKSIHEPYAKQPELAAKSGYPRPIIELNEHREQVMQAFKNLK